MVSCFFLTLLLSSASAFANNDNGILYALRNGKIIETNEKPMACDNVTDGGIIQGSQTSTVSPYTPPAFVNVQLPSGGTGALEYMWLSTTTPNNTNFATWMMLANSNTAGYSPGPLTETTYFVRCSRRAGCTDYVKESNLIIITINNCDPITDAGKIGPNQFGCGTTFDPALIQNTTTPTGGTGTIQYQWYSSTLSGVFSFGSPAWTVINGANASSYDPGVISATTHYIRVARRAGCTNYMAGNIITAYLKPAPIVTYSVTQPDCYGGSNGAINLTVSGGQAPYDFMWNFGSIPNGTEDPSGLAAGNYAVTVSDAASCMAMLTIPVGQPNPMVTVSNVTNVKCFGAASGTASISVTGGTAPYTYVWSNGQTGSSVNGLSSGTYQVTITDSKNCIKVTSVKVTQPSTALICTLTSSDAKCAGGNEGKATVSATGGVSPFTYKWNTGATTATLSGLVAGTYTATVTDANGCTHSGSVNVKEPTAISVSTVKTDVACFNGNTGSVSVTVTGGNAPYTYLWNTGVTTSTISNVTAGTYTVTVKDANGCTKSVTVVVAQPNDILAAIAKTDVKCNGAKDGTATVNASGGTSPYTYAWSNGAKTAAITGLAPGTYSVTVTDGAGCVKVASVVVTEPAVLSCTSTKTDVKCNGSADGSISVSVTGGTPNYTYVWSNGSTTATITKLTAGTYTVTVTDKNACTKVASVTIAQPADIAIAITKADLKCYNDNSGTASAVVTGGTTPYIYTWSNGSVTSTASGLAAGDVSVTITDANGCKKSATVTLTQPTDIALSTSKVDVKCFGISSGGATVNATGGSAPYTYAWSNGGNSSQITNISAGTYTVTVTDANACKKIASVIVAQPTDLVVTTSKTDLKCNGDKSGSALVAVSGGTSPYTYLWSNGATTTSITGLSGGTYTGTVTDANGCTKVATITVVEPADLKNAITKNNVKCNGDSNGSISIVTSGGSLPYSYLWNNGVTNSSLTGLNAGTYTITVTDKNACSKVETIVIDQPAVLLVATASTPNKCNGGNDASASANVSGGTAPYTYVWNTGGSTATINNLVAGTYSVTVTDANGCIKSAVIVVAQPALLSVGVSTTDVKCFGDKSGSATANVSGGTAPYTYAWSNAATGATATGLVSGSYSVTVTDANACVKTVNFTITQPNALLANIIKTDVKCKGGNDGFAQVNVTGGKAPYTYIWSNAKTTSTNAGLTAGTYTVTVTDANGCTLVQSTTVNEPAEIVISTTKTDVACFNSNTGSVSTTVTGGTAPYSYVWSNGAITASLTNVQAGTYTLNVTDANGCKKTTTVVIAQPTNLVLAPSKSDVKCNGGSDGSAATNATGGTAPYNYTWSNGPSTASITGVKAGTYTATVTDANGCTKSATIIIGEPTPITAAINKADVKCKAGNDGTALVLANGGTTPFTYTWSNGSTTAQITGLTAGTYTVTITDANACTKVISTTINEPTEVVLTVTKTDVKCNNGTDASVTASATGGTAPYTYAWNNGSNAATLKNLAAGTYSVTVTDANGCKKNASITVAQPTELTVTSTKANVTCNGNANGSATVVAAGGTTPYTYNWSNGGTTATISGLSGGTYTATVTDANSCSKTVSVTVFEPTVLVVTSSKIDVKCNNDNTGSATVSAAGGTTPYAIVWNTGASTATINNLVAGTYTATVTDGNGCTKTASVTITQPNDLTLTSTKIDVKCNGDNTGSATATAAGGTAPYTYNWSNGSTNAAIANVKAGTYSVTVTDANACSKISTLTINEPTLLTITATAQDVACNSGSNGNVSVTAAGGLTPYSYKWSNGATTASVTNLSAGTYGVTVTDANNCIKTASVTIKQPTELIATITKTDLKCKGDKQGSASVTATGGTSTYSYNWSNGANTASISNLAAGTYSVTVTDANACSKALSVTVTEPTELVLATTKTDVKCNSATNGTATATATGGTASYTYKWSNGATSATISGLAPGVYGVTATDANGCVKTTSVTIAEPSTLVLAVSKSDVKCFNAKDGSASAIVTGGSTPYTYTWSNGGSTATISGLAPGTYSVTATDANACFKIDQVTIAQPNDIQVNIAKVDVKCKGGNSGSAVATATGGTAPLSFAWSTGASTSSVSNLSVGTYTVTVTDANACSKVVSTTIAEPTELVLSTSKVDLKCNGAADAKATVSATGGTAPYAYAWSNGATSATASNLLAGTYTVTVSDANACTKVASVTINAPVNIVVSVSKTDVTCNGGNNGTATASATGGSTPYTYLWSNGALTASTTGAAGLYTVTVTDANGCAKVTNVTIGSPDPIAITITKSDVKCNGAADGSVTASATGGTASYAYKWNNGSTSSTISGVSGGTYTVTVTDANGCTKAASALINEPTKLVAATTSTDVICNGNSNGSASATVSGGTSPYAYKWSNGGSTAIITGVAGGTYTVTVTDANACTSVSTTTVKEPTAIAISTVKEDIKCFGNGNGSAAATVTGGTAPYKYLWSNGSIVYKISNLTAGTYTLTVTDANNCTKVAKVTIAPASQITISAIAVDVKCNGGNDGSATATATGGSGTLTYSWSNGGTSATITGVKAGIYNVTATDAAGCAASTTITINEPVKLDALVASVDVKCNGGTDGTASATATGGTAPYTYSWTGGKNTATIQVGAGTYSVTVTDANACTVVKSVTVNQPTKLAVTVTAVNVKCNSANDASATAVATNGTAPYTYVWSNGKTGSQVVGLSPGAYTVTVTDANACTTVGNVTITQPDGLTVVINATNVKCYGSSDGSASTTVTGGKAPYAYVWSNGSAAASISAIKAGTYTVTVTDANGCSAIKSVTITEPTDIFVSATSVNVKCNGANDGSATATAIGGTAPITFTWSNATSGAIASSLVAGTYTVTATDANGCSKSTSVTITQPNALDVKTTTVNVNCFGSNTGSIVANVTGGTGTIYYDWSTGDKTSAITSITAGTYGLTVTDANGCKKVTSVTVSQPSDIAVNISNTSVKCNGGNDGSATANVSGGTAPYTYAWSNATTSATISGVTAGTYTVTITDKNGCVKIASTTINESSTIVLTTSNTAVKCNGGSTGSATVTASGGTGTLTYAWSNGATTATIANVAAGTYTVTVTDANSCKKSTIVSVNQPSVLTATATSNNVKCNGANDGSATVTAVGGTAPYSYAWSNNAGTTASVNGLAAATYSVTVTDANGCTATSTVTISQPAQLVATPSKVNIKCNGDKVGSASVTVTGGTAPYTYAWTNGATTATTSNLSAGQYDVVVTDANGCKVNASVVITEPTLLVISTSKTDSKCFGANIGTATVTATGGTAPYSYVWNTGNPGQFTNTMSNLPAGTYNVVVTDANGCSKTANVTVGQGADINASIASTNVKCNGGNDGSATATVTSAGTFAYKWSTNATTASISNLVAGTYSVTVTSADGCSKVLSTTVSQPNAITLTTSGTDVKCNGDKNGTVSVTATGGTAPYTYLWSTGGVNAAMSNLGAGSYSVTVTDANSCVKVASVSIGEPTKLVATANASAIKCNGANNGTANVVAVGGATPYTYTWSNGASTSTISNLTPGNYSVTVTDKNACSATQTVIVTEPSLLVATANSSNIKCNGGNDGTANTTATGGTLPYTYKWSNGAITSNLTSLAIGTYSVTITDANACTATASTTVSQPTTLALSLSNTNIICNGSNTGSVTSSVTGGTPAYTYAWSNGASTANLSNVIAGTYSVTVTDANGCSKSALVTVTQSPAIILNINKNDAICYGDKGWATLLVSNLTTGGFTILWSNGATTINNFNLAAGVYSVTVTDGNGCTKSSSTTINQPNEIIVTSAKTNVLCSGSATGSASVSVTGGTPGYDYKWSNGATTATINNLAAGSYSVSITDQHGCSKFATFVITQPAPLVCNAASTSPVTKWNGNDGGITASGTGGVTPYTFKWNTGASTASIAGLVSGTYTVTITDANGCTCSSTVTLTNPSKLGNYVWNDLNGNGIQDANEPGIPGVTVTLTGTTSTGQTVTLTTTTDASGMYIFDGLAPGTYKVTFGTPTGFTPTVSNAGTNDALDSDADPITGMTQVVTLGQGEYYPDLDAGFVKLVNLGNFVWFDDNRNGKQDPNEPGVPNVTVKLVKAGPDGIFGTADDVVVKTTTTNAQGQYLFTDVMPGMKYKVLFEKATLPTGYEFTFSNFGNDDTIDSDADVNGYTPIIMVMAGQADDLTWDAGIKVICNNLTDGGLVGPKTATQCGPGIPAPINNTISPTGGGTGTIEYVWLQSTSGPNYVPGSPLWTPVANSNSPNLQPGSISVTTWYIRCSRRAGCDAYPAESNIVERKVVTPPTALIIQAPTGSVCKLAMNTFSAQDAGVGATYLWDFGTGAVPQASTLIVNNAVMYNTTGTKTIKLTVSKDGCSTVTTITVNVVDCSATPLVQFTTFTAEAVNNTLVGLQWDTNEPENDKLFVVERSKDGINFQNIGTLDATTISVTPYVFTDKTPYDGTNYYRIKHINDNGLNSLSVTRNATIHSKKREVLVYPNPFNSEITIELTNPTNLDARIQVIDELGRTLRTISLNGGTAVKTVDLGDMPSGIYFIKVDYDGIKMQTFKMTKQD